jgi:hypothetical protein
VLTRESRLLDKKLQKDKKSVDKPGSVTDNHSSGTNVTVCLKQPTRIPHGSCVTIKRSKGFLFGLAPSGVCPATPVASRAVRSYRTISPLPVNRRYLFCGTFRRLTPPRRYLALYPMEPGLSSLSLTPRAIV